MKSDFQTLLHYCSTLIYKHTRKYTLEHQMFMQRTEI